MIAEAAGNQTVPHLQAAEFENIRKLAYDQFGLDLSPSKHGLVAARLGKKLRELGLSSYKAYYDYVQADRTGDALVSLIDSLTTNHTNFFREPRHFDFLTKEVFPALRHQREIHLWSAACSTGEEPYTIAMSLLEAFRDDTLGKVKIRASDISTRALEKGRAGIYASDRIRDIPGPVCQRYLLKGTNGAAGSYLFKPEVRKLIQFERLNLVKPIAPGYQCSVIFCRNIMIYFDRPTQQSLVQRLTQQLDDGGYLFIGHSESLNNIEHGLEYVSPATYRKPVKGRR